MPASFSVYALVGGGEAMSDLIVCILEITAAIVICLTALLITVPRIFLPKQTSAPLWPFHRSRQYETDHIGVNVGYRDICSSSSGRRLSCWYPCKISSTNRGGTSKFTALRCMINTRTLFRAITGFKVPFSWMLPCVEHNILTGVHLNAVYKRLVSGASRNLIVLVHDGLGSPLDLSHIANVLVGLGFVVIAPEFDDSIGSDAFETNLLRDDEIKYVMGWLDEANTDECETQRAKNSLLKGRAAILREAVKEARSHFELNRKVGLVGHGIGAETVTYVKSKNNESFVKCAMGGFYVEDGCLAVDPSARGDPIFAILGERDAHTPSWKVTPHFPPSVAGDSSKVPTTGKSVDAIAPLLVPQACRMSFRCHGMCCGINLTASFFLSLFSTHCVASPIDTMNYSRGSAADTGDFVLPHVCRFMNLHMQSEGERPSSQRVCGDEAGFARERAMRGPLQYREGIRDRVRRIALGGSSETTAGEGRAKRT